MRSLLSSDILIRYEERMQGSEENHFEIDQRCILNITICIHQPYLFSTEADPELVEVSEAFTGETWAALEAGDVSQGGEVILEDLSSASGLQVQSTVANTG